MTKVISNFNSLNQRHDPSKLVDGQHPLVLNARLRDNVVSPISCPEQDVEGLPSTRNIQGLYTAQNLSLVFVNGEAYYKDYTSPASFYTKIPDFQMDPDVARIYVALVPASTLNYKRVSADGNATGAISFTSTINQTPQAVVVQDNVNQPWVIFPDGTARETMSFGGWTTDNREYVPIGNMMVFNAGILWVVSQDYKKLLRSVTGRPLDFVVAIDTDGDKLSEEAGDAYAVSHAVSYNNITCIAPLNTPGGELYVGSGNVSHIVIPDFDNTLFSEPRFTNQFLFSTAAINDISFIEQGGDFKFIDLDGLRSFNAVRQANNEGVNLPFSKNIHPLLEGLVQTTTCAATLNNLGFFAVNTIHGPGVLVFDELLDEYVSLDIYTGVGLIKQFAEIKVGNTRELLFIDENNNLFKHRGSQQELPGIFIGSFGAEDPLSTHRLSEAVLTFTRVQEGGSVTASSYVDEKLVSTRTKAFTKTTVVEEDPVALPFGNSTQKNVKRFRISFADDSELGVYVSLWLRWDFDGDLNTVVLNTIEKSGISHDDEADNYCDNVE